MTEILTSRITERCVGATVIHVGATSSPNVTHLSRTCSELLADALKDDVPAVPEWNIMLPVSDTRLDFSRKQVF